MRRKLDTLVIKTRTKAEKILEGKDAGIQDIVVTMLLCAIAVPCCAFFKSKSTDLLSNVFTATLSGATDLLKGFTS